MLVIAVVSQKGGVGKTTLTLHLGWLLSQSMRVTVVDLDPQGTASFGLGVYPDSVPGVADWLRGGQVTHPVNKQLGLIAGGPSTAFIRWGSPEELITALGSLECDLVLLDCPPSLGPAVVSAIYAADRALIPVHADPYVLVGLKQVLGTIDKINCELPVDVVRSRVMPKWRLNEEADTLLKQNPRYHLLTTAIPMNVAIAEASVQGMSVVEYAPKSKGAIAYQQLVAEIEERWALDKVQSSLAVVQP